MKPTLFMMIAIFASPVVFGQLKATTEDGKAVLLFEDGTWKYAPRFNDPQRTKDELKPLQGEGPLKVYLETNPAMVPGDGITVPRITTAPSLPPETTIMEAMKDRDRQDYIDEEEEYWVQRIEFVADEGNCHLKVFIDSNWRWQIIDPQRGKILITQDPAILARNTVKDIVRELKFYGWNGWR